MTTSNGYTFKIKNEICVLTIPKTQGIHNSEIQKAKIEICQNDKLPYYKEIRVVKKL